MEGSILWVRFEFGAGLQRAALLKLTRRDKCFPESSPNSPLPSKKKIQKQTKTNKPRLHLMGLQSPLQENYK